MTSLLWLAIGIGVALVGRVTRLDPHLGRRGSISVGAVAGLLGGLGFHALAEVGPLVPTFPNVAAALAGSAYLLASYYAVHVPALRPARRLSMRARRRRLRR